MCISISESLVSFDDMAELVDFISSVSAINDVSLPSRLTIAFCSSAFLSRRVAMLTSNVSVC